MERGSIARADAVTVSRSVSLLLRASGRADRAGPSCDWMADPTRFVNGTLHPDLHRRASTAYAKLVIVAHSLGAIVVRKALRDAFKANLAAGHANASTG